MDSCRERRPTSKQGPKRERRPLHWQLVESDFAPHGMRYSFNTSQRCYYILYKIVVVRNIHEVFRLSSPGPKRLKGWLAGWASVGSRDLCGPVCELLLHQEPITQHLMKHRGLGVLFDRARLVCRIGFTEKSYDFVGRWPVLQRS